MAAERGEHYSTIDTGMHGYPRVTASFVVRGEKIALLETGPKSVVHNVIEGLERLGIEALDWIVVTHIHLDHAGAAGTLAQRFPEARVAVHEIGAPHLVNPTKLWKSAARIYGEDMERLWGGIDPIREGRITVMSDGAKIDLGGRSLQAIQTPGHAYHHHSFLDSESGTLFAGDAIGVRLPDVDLIRPATPPPEFHLELAIGSIERIRGLGAEVLCPTHFGAVDRGVDETCDEAIEALRKWTEWVTAGRKRSNDLDTVAEYVKEQAREHFESRLSDEAVKRLEQTTSYWMNTWGYMRYFDKKAEAAPSA
jgi:glyoxylase-like metal-dependent hydrolase (beta-lactamase superfamily II)